MGGVLQNSIIQFIGQDQPFWNPPSNCVGMTSDSTIQISNINCIRPMLEEPLNDEVEEVEEIPDSLDEETV